jgi:hypothetical protein
MQLKGWKSFFSAILLAFSGAKTYFIGGDAAWGKQLPSINSQQQAHHSETSENIKPKLAQTKTLTVQSNPESPINSRNKQLTQQEDTNRDNQQPNQLPQLEEQPRVLPQPAPEIIEELLDKPSTDRYQRLQKLRQLLQQSQQNSATNKLQELNLRVRPRTLPQAQPITENNSQELELRVRPRPLPKQPTPSIKQPVANFRPLGSLQAQVGYFHSSNIFSSQLVPTDDSLMFYGIRLASAYFPLTSKTYINGSIEGNLVRYMEQARFNYNQLTFNISIYQQFSPRMYGELAGSNQQFFYARNSDSFAAGDRFLNENSLRLSLGRRDPLNSRLSLDSFYQISATFSDPNNRSRIINSLWFSLNYSVQPPFQVGINYQLNLSEFTQQQRDDKYHRIFGHIFYRVSDSSSLNLQSGINFGDSTDNNIDFDGWFFTVYYNLRLGEF